MICFRSLVYKFIADETGSGAIEYGLIGAGVGLAIVGSGLCDNLNAKFAAINALLK